MNSDDYQSDSSNTDEFDRDEGSGSLIESVGTEEVFK